jgi:predicted nucleic acid-binding protein
MRGELFLVDTSIWLEVLPPGRNNQKIQERIDGLLSGDLVAITGMVRLELLGGARSQAEWERLNEFLSALHQLPITEEHWQEAARIGFQLRRQGITVPFTDLLIGAVALKADVVLFHRDRHFDFIASQIPLKVGSYVAV